MKNGTEIAERIYCRLFSQERSREEDIEMIRREIVELVKQQRESERGLVLLEVERAFIETKINLLENFH